jgi:hypothetical protein
MDRHCPPPLPEIERRLTMYLVELITDDGYSTSEPCLLEDALAVANALRTDFVGKRGFVGVRIINLAFVTRW